MKFEDLFKYYMYGDNPEDNPYNPDEDPDEWDDDEDDDGEESESSNNNSNDQPDDELDDEENQDQQDDNDRRKRRDDKDDKNEEKDDSGKDADNASSDENGNKAEDSGKTDAGQDQSTKDSVDKNLDEKDTENKLREAKEREADGSKGHTSSDTGAQNPLQEADAGGLGNEGPQGKGPGDSPKGAGDSPTGGPKGGAGDSPAGGPKGGGAGVEQAGKGAAQETGKKAAQETGKKAAEETAKKGAETSAKVGADLGVKGATATAGAGGTAAAGSGAAASGAGGGGLISLIGATVPWSLIVIAVIIIIIIIIIIISFFQTLPGSMLDNLKTSVKKWFSNLLANFAENIGFEDNSLRVNQDDVNRLAQYINDMGYDIQTYGFGDIIVKSEDKDKEGLRDDREANGVDKKVEDDGETSEIKCKSKYLKAYLAADECTYHFRAMNILNTFFSSSTAQQGLIEIKDDGGLLNQYRDQIEMDRKHEDLVIYNRSLDIPIIGWFKKLFTGSRSFKWGEMFRYDLNTWIGRYKRPVELFLAIHLSTMMPDLTYRIATEQRFNTEVDVRFEPIKVCIRGNLANSSDPKAAYINVNTGNGAGLEKKYVIDIVRDYLALFECHQGLFDSKKDLEEDNADWENYQIDDNNIEELWEIFIKLYDRFSDEGTLDKIVNFFCDWKKITLENARQVLIDDDFWLNPDDEINFEEGHPEFYGFYSMFGCDYNHLARSTVYKEKNVSRKFNKTDLKDMIEQWNEYWKNSDGTPAHEINYDDEERDYRYLSLHRFGWGDSEKYKDDNYDDLKISYVDNRVKLKIKDELKDLDSTAEKVTLAFIVYKMATEDRMADSDGGIDGVLWPFVEQVKNHWYYKDIDFLGTTEENATYRLARVGYKTIEYKTEEDGKQYYMSIPGALHPDTSKGWDLIVYQVAEPVTMGCNDAIRDVFSGEYYRYDGTVEKAKSIANSRAIDEGKSKYYYGGTDYPVEKNDKSKAIKEIVSMPNSPEQTLQSLAILKNMHSVSSDYIYRDLKELYVKLDYYSKEQMTEDLTLMWLWPIKVDNKNATFDLVETHDKFGKSIVAYQNAEVLAPCDGTIKKEDNSYEITVTSLNSEAEELLQYIFRNDYYRINKTKLNGLKIRLDGLTLYDSVGSTVTRGQTIGKVNNASGKLNVTVRFADKTVVDDITEYMREDHNNKYEEIMRRRKESEEGTLPPVPLRTIFGYDAGTSGLSVSGYNRTPSSEPTDSAQAKAIYEGLKGNFDDEQIAGALGNVHYESGGLQTNNLENSYERSWGTSDQAYTNAVNSGGHPVSGKNFIHDSAGYGMAQWTYWSRKESLWNKASRLSPVNVADLGIQVELLREEMSGGWAVPIYKNDFMSCGSGEDGVMIATKAYCYGFENPADPEGSMQDRISLALGYYNLIKDGKLGTR